MTLIESSNQLNQWNGKTVLKQREVPEDHGLDTHWTWFAHLNPLNYSLCGKPVTAH